MTITFIRQILYGEYTTPSYSRAWPFTMRLHRTVYLLPLAVFSLLLTPQAHADFQDGKDAYDRSDYETALKEWRPLAEQGNAEAQFRMGRLYDYVQQYQDLQEAIRWYRLAAEQGLPAAQNSLGLRYSIGRGVPHDYKEAVRWWLLAAEQEFAEAQYWLGVSYEEKRGVPEDYKEALRWYRLAANKGSVAAQHRLGLAYANGGLGFPKDYREAFLWYRLAVEQHDDRNIERTEIVLALYSLGEFYANGQGVPQDYVQAHMWYNLAAGQNVERAAKAREDLAKSMTSEQIAEAERLAREWLAQHQK